MLEVAVCTGSVTGFKAVMFFSSLAFQGITVLVIRPGWRDVSNSTTGPWANLDCVEAS